ncbi:MAG: insulinase family protein [Deltaproteobacteria bacterium]|nr:insulinase family protein [Deltaproteobacteria bacterium]
MFAKTVLDSGIRVLSHELANTRSVSLGIWVENGSRHEARDQNGISHFIEHLLFKGTERRTAARIAEEMDAVGGVLNAFTGKEYTCYYAKVLDENLPMAIDLLTDIFRHSVFDREEIERERSVILQEISQAEDTPDDYVHDLFNLDFFKDHPLGRPICGEAATVANFHRDNFLAFIQDRYRPGRVIVAAAGHLRHEDLVREMERRLGDFENSNFEIRNSEWSDSPRPQSGVFHHPKDLEQVHLCLGVTGIPQSHPLRYAALTLNTVLGGGMSSRLFQEIREKRGRAYSVYSFLASYKDVGYLGIYAGTSRDWVEEVVELILKETGRLAGGDIAVEEIERAKNQLIGNMLLGLETSDSWMNHIARNEIYFGTAVSVEEISRGVRSVSREDLVRLASETFRPEAVVLTLLGDLKDGFSAKSLDLNT